MNLIRRILVGILVFIFAGQAMANLPAKVLVKDTVAGFPTALRSSLIEPNQQVRFVVEKPDGSVVQIPSQADLGGVAEADLFGHQTKQAGDYLVSLVYSGSSEASLQSLFKVFPGPLSKTQSTVKATLPLLQAKKDSGFVVVGLLDQYQNPIKDHQVKLLSSRSEDHIEPINNGLTDQNGRASFKISSDFAGVSVLTAMSVTANEVLSDREEIVFSSPVESKTDSNSLIDLFKAEIGGESVLPGPVNTFDIEGLPASATPGEELSLTVVAKDANDNIAKNYTGTILISVPDDENAILPNNGEYTFKAADQGRFTFDLSLQFSRLGLQAVQVFDKGNFKISGEAQIEIASKNTSSVGVAGSKEIEIKSPAEGSRLGSSLVLISGIGPENVDLKIFDNDIKIGETETDIDGFFTFEATNLTTGDHEFFVMSNNGEVSERVSVEIDSLPPVLNELSVNPEGQVLPGERIEVVIQTEPNLDLVQVRLQGIEQSLQESSSQPGSYQTLIAAPSKNGSYPLDVVLIDELGNKAELSARKMIQVKVPELKQISSVSGLSAVATMDSVALSWIPVIDTNIEKYEISYGQQIDQLSQTFITSNSTPSAFVEGLSSNTQYFFSVKAVDSSGLKSNQPSEVLSVNTRAADICSDVSCGENGICIDGKCSCKLGYFGENCEESILLSSANSSKAKSIKASVVDGKLTLSWLPFDGVQAFYYKIHIGFSEGQYDDFIITQNNGTSIVVEDLIDSLDYYFAVSALDLNKVQISQVSDAVKVNLNQGKLAASSLTKPSFNEVNTNIDVDLKSAAPVDLVERQIAQQNLKKVPQTQQVGPAALWIIFLSVLGGHFWYHRKKKMKMTSLSIAYSSPNSTQCVLEDDIIIMK